MATKVTAPSVLARKGGLKLKMVTAYDAPTARIANRAGADIILVGDSVANVVLGYEDTLAVTVDVTFTPRQRRPFAMRVDSSRRVVQAP